MARLLKQLIQLTKPWVWRVAEAYDLRVDRPHFAYGRNALDIEDQPHEAVHHIPKTVRFNTSSGDIFVGKNTVFGDDVQVLTGKHLGIAEADASGQELHFVPNGRDVRIGRNCYIGGGAILIGPLVIGNYAMIGAGAVVTKDVPAHAFVAGPRAQIIRTGMISHGDQNQPESD
jgi:acetyltransferase-like isoleucine patch superfamily enzyme